MVKCIAIGNRLMGDDSIGLRVLEALSDVLEDEPVQLIFGETDCFYALSEINHHDYLIILDAAMLGKNVGELSIIPIGYEQNDHYRSYSMHEMNLIDCLKLNQVDVEGIIVGIEVNMIDYSLELSDELKEQFNDLTVKVYQIIKKILEEQYA